MEYAEIATIVMGGIVSIFSILMRSGITKLNLRIKEESRNYSGLNNRINGLESKLNENSEKMKPLADYITKKEFSDAMPVKMKALATDVKDKYFLNDRELDIQIDIATSKIADIIKNVMKSNFPDNTPKLLKNELIGAAKFVRSNTTSENINSVTDTEKYFEAVKNDVVLPAISNFCEKTEKIMGQHNGTRLQSFQDISLDFVENLITRILQIRS
jgi:hypothetical protein